MSVPVAALFFSEPPFIVKEAGYTTPNQYDVQLTGGLRLRNFLFIGAGVWYIAQPAA